MLKILIVDDTRSVHSFLKVLLKQVGDINTVGVFDGREALAALANDPQFDLILLDWEMPNLDGPSTLAELKRLGIRVPVVMMTTKNQPSEIASMLENGAAEYLLKPFTLDILIERLESASGRALQHAVG